MRQRTVARYRFLASFAIIAGSILVSYYLHRSLAGSLTNLIVTNYDKIPDFAANPTQTSIKSGNWSDPSVWFSGKVPTETDVVSIANGTTVTVSDTSAVAKTVGIVSGGTLTFKPSVPTKLKTVTLLDKQGGSLIVGTAAAPITSTAEIVIADAPLDTDNDPRQYGNGIVALGTIHMYGHALDASYIRLAKEPKVGDTTLTLSDTATGWRVGDTVLIPDTRQAAWPASQVEQAVISSVSADGRTLTMGAALKYDHLGAYDADKTLKILPDVTDITRNILIHSENPAGVRGHTLITQYADTDIRYAWFKDMGRTTAEKLDSTTFNPDGTVAHIGTNQIARYALHMHHLIGPQEGRGAGIANVQFQIIGNSVTNGERWGIDVHGSHFGIVQNNVVYDMKGAGIVTEDGTETGNKINHNMVIATSGVGKNTNERNADQDAKSLDVGFEGTGIWLRGENNDFSNNVVTDSRIFGLSTFPIAKTPTAIPAYAGADPFVAAQGVPFNLDHLNYDNIESYGVTDTGLMWLGQELSPTYHKTIITGDTVWNAHAGLDAGSPNAPFRWVNYTFYGDPTKITAASTAPVGSLDSWSDFVNPTIENASTGMMVNGQTRNFDYGYRLVQGGTLRNVVNIKSDFFDDYQNGETTIILKGIGFGSLPGIAQNDVQMAANPKFIGSHGVFYKKTWYLLDYGAPGKDYELFRGIQNASATIPDVTMIDKLHKDDPNLIKEVGLTNQVGFTQKDGRAVSGKIASCTNTLPTVTSVSGKYLDAGHKDQVIPFSDVAYACPLQNVVFSGTVTDAAGAAVAGAIVDLDSFQMPYGDNVANSTHKEIFAKDAQPKMATDDLFTHIPASPYVPDLTAQTDAQGKYRIVGRLTAGDSVGLTVTKPGYQAVEKLLTKVTGDQVTSTVLTAGGGNGLKGVYTFLSADATPKKSVMLTRTDPQIDIDWKKSGLIPGISIPQNRMTVSWSGELVPLYSEDYHFFGTPTSQITITVDGVKTTLAMSTNNFSSLALKAGVHYPISIVHIEKTTEEHDNPNDEYSEQIGQLLWSSSSTPKQVIPQSQLYSTQVDQPLAGLCLKMAFDPTLVSGVSRPNIAVTLKKGATAIASTTAYGSDSDGLVYVPLTGATPITAGQYDAYIKAPGFLNRKVSVTVGASGCASVPADKGLVPGKFAGSGNGFGLGDLITLIGAYNGSDTATVNTARAALGHTVSLSDIIKAIKTYNDPSRNKDDF